MVNLLSGILFKQALHEHHGENGSHFLQRFENYLVHNRITSLLTEKPLWINRGRVKLSVWFAGISTFYL